MFLSSDTAAPPGDAGLPYPPKWKYFVNAPPLDYSSTDNRKTGCWETTNQTGCDRKEQNLASRAPWDVDPSTGPADLHHLRQQRGDRRVVAVAADPGPGRAAPGRR